MGDGLCCTRAVVIFMNDGIDRARWSRSGWVVRFELASNVFGIWARFAVRSVAGPFAGDQRIAHG